jgi:N-acetylmuramoyl-L-alanine amidase
MNTSLRKTDRTESGEDRLKETGAASASRNRAAADSELSDELFSSKGKVLGLFLTAAVFLIGGIAAPVSLHRTSSAASAEAVAPSVMVGAGTETYETASPAEAETGEQQSGREESRQTQLRNQTSMWLSSIAESLDNVKEPETAVEPSDSSGAQAIQSASLITSDAGKVIAENRSMSYTDYTTLLNIVEAECTGGDEKSKLLVADVILNRVADSHFPDNVYDVVWQRVGGTAQFSPTQDGRMGTLTISDSTIKAVKEAIGGKNISDGALFFMARKSSSSKNVDWFDETLEYLYSYGGHDYYKFK